MECFFFLFSKLAGADFTIYSHTVHRMKYEAALVPLVAAKIYYIPNEPRNVFMLMLFRGSLLEPVLKVSVWTIVLKESPLAN